MFGTEDGVERNSRRRREYINGALPRRVNPSLVRYQPDVPLCVGSAAGWLHHIEAMFLEHIDSRLHGSIASAHATCRAEGFVIARNALPSQIFFFIGSQGQRRRDLSRNLRAQPDRVSLPAWMHGIGQQNDISMRRRIDPDGCSCEPGVSERAHREKITAIRRERRIDVPSKSAQNGRGRRLFGGCHLRNRLRRQDSIAAIQQSLREFRQIVPGRKEPCVPGHATHAPRRGVVHHAVQHLFFLIVLCRCDLRPPRRRRHVPRMRHLERGKDVLRRVGIERLSRDLFDKRTQHDEVDIAVNKTRTRSRFRRHDTSELIRRLLPFPGGIQIQIRRKP